MEIDFTKKCRTCLSDDEQMHYLFDEFDQGITLQDILISTSKFQINKNDGLSSYICQNCASIVVDFYNLIIIYKENENQIKTLLENVKNNLGTSFTLKTVTNLDINSEIDDINDGKVLKLELEGDDFITIKVDSNSSDNEDSLDDNCQFQQDLVFDGVPTSKANELCFIEDPIDDFSLSDKFTTVPPEYQQINTYTCPVCGECFLHKNDIKDHMIAHHNVTEINYDKLTAVSMMKVNDDNDYDIHQCKICSQPCENLEAYKEHLATHKKNVCDVCGVGFVKKSYLKDHQEIHCTEKRHICSYCNKAFKRRTVLVKHKRIHTNPRECICEMCGKAFNDKGTLKTHIMLLHIRTRKYTCLICGIKFPLKATLEKHVRRHNKKERAFFCTQCPLAYKDKSSLDRHIYVKHSGQSMKAICNDCGRQYTTVSNLLKHKKSCHIAPITATVIYNDQEWVNDSEATEWVDESVEEKSIDHISKNNILT